ncbi:uncharacterized protein LY79DRAFT_592508 [Colletotrichum navitas]|uniref:Zn(2)-C6 fungal-type domain-containing protein n=1 Tax=Colletotrichum navitas TaxID=681940 RepID=A0AAD8V1L3_9PEZI|nr:uncharacterized protein LY79DRAFT_592508 [Colletotrichum navitas]KAK1580086.1 hypothetical protein LY79DRAFT_592508 [Colletotrichum navitas]
MSPIFVSYKTPATKRRCYREIRPALESGHSHVTASCPDTTRKRSLDDDDDVAPGPPLRQPSSSPEQKRRNVSVACESCRKRKIKCSAGQPKCSGCMAKGLECRYNSDPSESRVASLKRKYDEIASRNDSLERFYAVMRSMPEGQAYQVLKRIRSGASADDIVREIEAGCLLMELASRGDETAHGQEQPEVAEAGRPMFGAEGVDISRAYPSWTCSPVHQCHVAIDS